MKSFFSSKKIFFICVLSLIFMVCFYNSLNPENVLNPTDDLIVVNSQGQSLNFRVSVADNDEKRGKGLMFIKNMQKNEGMLFFYDTPRVIYMWMKNTFISLDMIFIDESGKVLNIIHNTTPLSERILSSKEESYAVLEVNSGICEGLNIDKNSRILHKIFK